MGNPNFEFKKFYTNNIITKVAEDENIYLYKMNGKIRTLSQAYFTNYIHYNDSFNKLPKPMYLLIERNEVTVNSYLNNNSDNLTIEKLGSYNNWDLLKLKEF